MAQTTNPAVGQTLSFTWNNGLISGDSWNTVDSQIEHEVNSFTSLGATEIARGFYKTEVTAGGFWNLAGNPQTAGLIIGTAGRLVMRINNVVVRIIPVAVVSNFSVDGDVNRPTRWSASFTSDWVTGNFAGANN